MLVDYRKGKTYQGSDASVSQALSLSLNAMVVVEAICVVYIKNNCY